MAIMLYTSWMPKIEIVEVSPRDGLQNEATVLPVDTKVDPLERCVAAGVRRIEAVSFVDPRRVPQMAGAEAVMARMPRAAGVSWIGLVLNQRGLDRALAAGVDEVNVVVVATDIFSLRNQGVTTSQAVDVWIDLARQARAAGIRATVTIGAAFGCPFEGEVAPGSVLDLVRRVAEAGPDELAIADTIGVGVPAQVRAIVSGIRDIVPGMPLRAHFHTTRNTGFANALAAVEEGVGALDASAGGIGGCPFAPAATGNIATEDLLYALHRSGYETGVDGEKLAGIGTWISTELGHDRTAAMLGRAGVFPPQHLVPPTLQL